MMAVAVALSVEILSFSPQQYRADAMLGAMGKVAGRVKHTRAYRGGSDLLMLWGPGHPARFEPMRRQIANGGHCAVWDLAYWDRQQKVRVSIDAAHPQAWVMRKDWPRSRLAADRIVLGDAWNPEGPVIVAGLGDKARVQYGATTVDRWEADMMAQARARGRTVIYRPKPKIALVPIETALRGASLVITWHSNVAIDAIRLGIPAICRDGAAAAVCPSTFGEMMPQPLSTAVRDRFLANLAWFQWAPSEAKHCWKFLTELLT